MVAILSAPMPANVTAPLKGLTAPLKGYSPEWPKPVFHKYRAGDSACDYLMDYLDESMCDCEDKQGGTGAIAQCSINVLNIDTVGVRMDFEPCADPLYLSLDVTESAMGFEYNLGEFKAGEDDEVPIPGLMFGIPLIGSAQAEMAIKMSGNIQDLTVQLGLDACMSSIVGTYCGKDLTSGLPIYFLSGTMEFSDLCYNKANLTKTAAIVEKA